MKKAVFTEAELREMAELNRSAEVKAARKAQRDKYKEKQKLYTLRHLKKQGEKLLARADFD